MATSALPKDLSKLEVKTGNIKHNYQNQRVSSSVDTSDVGVIAYSNKPVAGGAEGQKQKDFIPGDGDGFSEVKQKKNKWSNKKPGSSSPSPSPAAANHQQQQQQQQPQQAVAQVDSQKKGDHAASVATATPAAKVDQAPATKKPQNQKANGGGANTGTATKSAPATGAPAVSNQKKALAKKLRQIERLKQLKTEGKTLSEEETKKVATEQDLQSQLKKLK